MVESGRSSLLETLQVRLTLAVWHKSKYIVPSVAICACVMLVGSERVLNDERTFLN